MYGIFQPISSKFYQLYQDVLVFINLQLPTTLGMLWLLHPHVALNYPHTSVERKEILRRNTRQFVKNTFFLMKNFKIDTSNGVDLSKKCKLLKHLS